MVFALTFWKSCISIFKFNKNGAAEPRKIIFIKLIEQGATVLAYSAMEKAIETVGANNVFFLVFSENKPVLEIIGIIPNENIFEIRNNGFFAFVYDVLKCVIRIRKINIDTAIDMEFFSRFSAVLTYCSGAKNRVGNHCFLSEQPYRGNLMTHKIQYNPFVHVATAYLLLVDSLYSDKTDIPLPKLKLEGIKILTPKYLPNAGETEEVKTLVSAELNDKILFPVIILNPNASDLIPIRKWELSNFIGLSQKLIDHFKSHLTIIITGGQNEIATGKEFYNKINSQRVINLAGKTSIKQLFTLYSISDVLVTNDSGPGHFASMTEIKDIVLFGPETPRLYGPLGENVFCIESNISCSPCVNPYNYRFSPCKNNVCMQSISVDTVFNKIIEVLPL